MRTLREDTGPLLAISSGNELTPYAVAPADATKARAQAAAYALMDYDLWLLTAGDAEALDLAGNDVGEETWIRPDGVDTVFLHPAPDLEVAAVLLPGLPIGVDAVDKRTRTRLGRAVVEARRRADLVVAVGAWGFFAEEKYFKSGPEHLPDIFIGGGPGMGLSGRLEAAGRCLWVRPYGRGKAVGLVELLALPDSSLDFSWKKDNTILFRVQSLDDHQQPHPAVVDLLKGVQ
mgnify:CR=1 FL=1